MKIVALYSQTNTALFQRFKAIMANVDELTILDYHAVSFLIDPDEVKRRSLHDAEAAIVLVSADFTSDPVSKVAKNFLETPKGRILHKKELFFCLYLSSVLIFPPHWIAGLKVLINGETIETKKQSLDTMLTKAANELIIAIRAGK